MTVEVTRNVSEKKAILTEGYYAEEAIPEGSLVKVGTSDGTILVCDEDELAFGICEREIDAAMVTAVDDGDAGKNTIFCPVTVLGISTCLTAGAIAAGVFVSPGAGGTVIAAPLDGSDYIFGICLNTATAAGDQVSVIIDRSPYSVRL